MPFYNKIQNARELLSKSKDEQIINNVRVLLNEQQKYFEEKLIELPKDFFKKYDDIKNIISGNELNDISSSDIKSFARYFSMAAMERY